VEITVSELRKDVNAALAAVKNGDSVVVTEGGAPIARIGSAAGDDLLASLVKDGLITPPAEDRAVPRLPQAEAAKDALSSLLGRLRR
jgi:prevent-host-death family protein